MSEKISSNHDIRNFFKTNDKENSLKISQNKQKISLEPLFELQPSLDLEKSPSPPRIEKFNSSHVQDSSGICQSSNENEEDSDSIPELDEIANTNEGTKPKIGPKRAKKRKKKLYGGAKKKCKKEPIPNNLDLGPNEFSEESNDDPMKSEKPQENVKNEDKTDEAEEKDEEEYDVEEILDYKWCLATVSFSIFMFNI